MPQLNGAYYFISYSRKQFYIADRLSQALRERRCPAWLDVEQIGAGDDWQATIELGLQRCQALIVVATRAAYRSPSVRNEVDAARRLGKPIYLLVIDQGGYEKELAGQAAIIDCRRSFDGAISDLTEALLAFTLPVTKMKRAHLADAATIPIGQTKLKQLALLNLCFLIGTIALAAHIKVVTHWPLNPRIEPFLVFAMTPIVLWLMSFVYSLFLLFAFRYQRRVTFLELDLWPVLSIFLFPMLFILLGQSFETVGKGNLITPKFSDAFNQIFSIQYRTDNWQLVFIILFFAIIWLFYRYLILVPQGIFIGVIAILCTILVHSSSFPSILAILLLAGVSGIWLVRQSLASKTLPIALGMGDQRFKGLHFWLPKTDSVWGGTPAAPKEEQAWGYWLSPGAFLTDARSMKPQLPSRPAAARANSSSWKLFFLPADQRCAQRIRQIIAEQPLLKESTDEQVTFPIALLSNRTPRSWIEHLAEQYPHLICVIVSSVDIARLPNALHQNQWIDYRQQRPAPIRALAAALLGVTSQEVPATPEDLLRPLGPYPLKLVSHTQRINGVLALVLAVTALLIRLAYHQSIIPDPLIAAGLVLGIWNLGSGARLLARQISFAEIGILTMLNVLNIGYWVTQVAATLPPRAIRVIGSDYNQALTIGFGFIAAVIALPLLLFFVFGWIELLRNLRAFWRWLPSFRLIDLRPSLAVGPWRQLDFAYVPYAFSLLILVATLVVDAPARYAPLLEIGIPNQDTLVSYLAGPDQHIWFVSRYAPSDATLTTPYRYRLGYASPNGDLRIDRYTLPSKPSCLLGFACPISIGSDGSIAYVGKDTFLSLSAPSILTRVAPDGSSKTFELPDNALATSAVFDGSGNMWYERSISLTEPAVSKMSSDGQVTDFAYEPTTDPVNAQDGSIWLDDSLTHNFLHIDRDGTITTFHLTLPDFKISDLVLGADQTLWFMERKSGTIGHMAADGTFTFYPLNAPDDALRLMVGKHGAVWFLSYSRDVVGFLSSEGAPVTFPLGMSSLDVLSAEVGNDNQIYLMTKEQIIRFTQLGNHTLFDTPTLDKQLNALTRAPDGSLWYCEGPSPGIECSIIGMINP